MKPRNREINIFNLSMLDVISGALGAFLIIMIVLFPYYKKESIDYQRQVEQLTQQLQQAQQQAAQVEQLQEENRQAKADAESLRQELETIRQNSGEANQQLETAREENQQLRQQLQSAQQQLAKTFLMIYISWETKSQDIDLHLIDPTGAEFYFDQRTHIGRAGFLSVDTVYGPGNEVWEIIDAPPGDYKVYVKLYNKGNNNAWPTVKGRVSSKDGNALLPEIRLDSVNQKVLMATVKVAEDGSIAIQ
ncbi:MAG: hypothetical protein HQK72_04535 [Desulfamplus sp.]|nr:hypothetical protein [Desulfamplus sp.]